MKKDELNIQSVNNLFGFVKGHWTIVFFCVILSVIISAIDVSVGYFMKNLVDIIAAGRFNDLSFLIFFFTGMIIIGVIVKFCIKYSAGRFNNDVFRDLRKRIMSKINGLSMKFVENKHTGIIISKVLNDTSMIQDFFQDKGISLLYEAIIIVLSSAYLLTLHVELFIIIVFFVLLSLFLTKFLSRPISKFVQNRNTGYDKLFSVIQDTLTGIHIIKSFNLQKLVNKKYDEAADQITDEELKRQKRLVYMYPIIYVMIPSIPLLIIAALGGYLTIKSKISVGAFFAFIYLLKYIIDPLNNIPDLINDLRAALVSSVRLKDFLESPVEKLEGEKFIVNDNVPAIEFRNVGFSYAEKLPVFSSLNILIERNKCIALVGSSGCGKSTIFKLICNFYRPDAGSICMFGHDVNEWDLTLLRSKIAFVSQETYLYPASIADNIRVGSESASPDDIIEISKMAYAHEFIMDLPLGYETLIGDGGIRLSGGQSQRINLAKALLKKSEIILLDEPTSALDNQSEEFIHMTLDKLIGKKTIIIIAHRLSTIKNVDEILVMEKGSIIERGTHGELINKNSVYNRLYLNQFINNKNI